MMCILILFITHQTALECEKLAEKGTKTHRKGISNEQQVLAVETSVRISEVCTTKLM